MFAELTVTGILTEDRMEIKEVACLDDCEERSHGIFHRCENKNCAEYIECINR